MLITIINALLFPNSRLLLCQIVSYDFPNIRNLLKIFLRSFENVAPGDWNRISINTADRSMTVKWSTILMTICQPTRHHTTPCTTPLYVYLNYSTDNGKIIHIKRLRQSKNEKHCCTADHSQLLRAKSRYTKHHILAFVNCHLSPTYKQRWKLRQNLLSVSPDWRR